MVKAEEMFFCLWQLPQNLVGLAVVLITRATMYKVNGITVYVASLMGSGVCLGNYIVVDGKHMSTVVQGAFPPETLVRRVMHEWGHHLQSRMLGWLYLPVIGLPSLLGNLWSRAFNKDSKWYYAQPWEAWADRLGGVRR